MELPLGAAAAAAAATPPTTPAAPPPPVPQPPVTPPPTPAVTSLPAPGQQLSASTAELFRQQAEAAARQATENAERARQERQDRKKTAKAEKKARKAEAGMSEIDQLKLQAKRNTEDTQNLRLELLKTNLAAEHGIPKDLLHMIPGKDQVTIEQEMVKLKKHLHVPTPEAPAQKPEPAGPQVPAAIPAAPAPAPETDPLPVILQKVAAGQTPHLIHSQVQPNVTPVGSAASGSGPGVGGEDFRGLPKAEFDKLLARKYKLR